MRRSLFVGLVAVIGSAAAFAQEPVAQAPSERERTLEAENRTLKDQVAAAKAAEANAKQQPTLTPEEASARLMAAYTQAYADASLSAAAKACKATKGKRFAVAIIEGKAAPICDVRMR